MWTALECPCRGGAAQQSGRVASQLDLALLACPVQRLGRWQEIQDELCARWVQPSITTIAWVTESKQGQKRIRKNRLSIDQDQKSADLVSLYLAKTVLNKLIFYHCTVHCPAT